jgi:outer membrane protein assembly factor BamB
MRTVAFSDGTEQLSTELSISNQLKLPHYVYVAEGVVVTDIDDGYVTGFDRETGDQLWQRSHASGVTPPVTVVNGTVYLKGSSGHEVGEMAVELQTGDLEWEITPTGSGSCCNVTPAVSQDLAYIANTGSTGLVGVDTTGEIRWRYNGSAVPTAQPAVDDNSMYIPADDGNLYHIALQQS